MIKQEKKVWKKPVVQILLIKEITLSGTADHEWEGTGPGLKVGWKNQQTES